MGQIITREHLEEKHGKVWDKAELQEDFEVIGFGYGFCVVRHKNTRMRGSLDFTHMPRFYFNYVAE